MALLCLAAQLYVFVMFARIILSWFPIQPGSALAPVFSVLYAITEPVLGPIRRLLPPVGIGGMGIDLSPMIVTLAIQLVLVPLLC
ncbi:MAG: YggT family protein [Actinobacteria bacterium]|nr:YggT family protein [Actinomycetota bacterium]